MSREDHLERQLDKMQGSIDGLVFRICKIQSLAKSAIGKPVTEIEDILQKIIDI